MSEHKADYPYKIWKFKIEIGIVTKPKEIEMPVGAEILCIKLAGNDCVDMYTRIRDTGLTCTRKFLFIETGIEMGIRAWSYAYLGTCQFDGGDYVLHVFEAERGV